MLNHKGQAHKDEPLRGKANEPLRSCSVFRQREEDIYTSGSKPNSLVKLEIGDWQLEIDNWQLEIYQKVIV